VTPEFDALIGSFAKARARWAQMMEKNEAEVQELADEAEEVIRRLAPKPRLSQRDFDALATAYAVLAIQAGIDSNKKST
jgi:hypothetical protein